MKTNRLIALVTVLVVAAACDRQEQPRVDDALSRDLSLAATTQPAMPSFVSPQELANAQYAQQGYAPGYPQGYYPQPAYYPQAGVYRAPAPVARRAPRASQTPVYRAPAEPVYETVKHTKRDAAIGAAVGAAAGAAVSRDVKGAIIGAAAGGLLGAVIGNNVDVDRRRIP